MSSHPLPWLCRVTKNLCLNHIRDDRRRRDLLARQPPTSGREVHADARLAVTQLLARAPDDLQQVALCYYVDDLSHQEIAAAFGVSRRTIGNRLAAFEALAAELFGPDAPLPSPPAATDRL
jgi:RNA polymerase sigma factor (sigma-70 family)